MASPDIEVRRQFIRRVKQRIAEKQAVRKVDRQSRKPSTTIKPEVKKETLREKQKQIQRIKERIEAAKKPKQPITMTQQQYFQEVSEGKRAIGRQKSEYYATMESIDPGASYEYEGRVVTGAVLKTKFEKEYLPQLEEAELQSQLAWSQARDLPKDTTITKTKEGYEFKFRDTSLDWSKGEFKKIGQAPPGVQQVAEFGFGAVSSFGALLKPIVLDSSSEGKKMPKKRAPTGGKLQKPLGKKISFSQ